MNELLKRDLRRQLVRVLSIVAAVLCGGCGKGEPGPTVENPVEAKSNDASIADRSSQKTTPASAKKDEPAAESKPIAKAAPTELPAVTKAPKQAPAAQPKQESPAPPAATREAAVAELAKVGGKVFFDDKKPDKPAIRIRVQNRRATDAVLSNLKLFPEVTQIEIIYPSDITDAALANLEGLSNIQSIDLEGTKIADAGLEHLKGLTNVDRLRLINTRITGAGLAHLKGMTKLKQLVLAFTDVGDDGLAHLEGMKNLQQLELDDTKVTQAGVDRLKKALPKCNIQWSPNGGTPTVASITKTGDDKPQAAEEPRLSDTQDWPGWRGPNRDARSTETGLLQEWPAEGPPLLWTTAGIGSGYATVAIADGRIFTTGRLGNAKPGTYLFCCDATDGKKLWERFIVDDKMQPFSMPTVDGDMVYVLGHEGDLVCVKSSNGDEVWRKNFIKDFGGDYMGHGTGGGYAESVLIDGDRLICTPGAKDAALVALNKKTGETVWKAAYPADVGSQGHDAAGMSSVLVSNACGIRQYVQMSGRGLISVATDSGKTLWAYNGIANTFANISTPIVSGDYVFASTVQGSDRTAGTALLKLVPDNGGVKAEVVYRLDFRTAANHHGGMVLVGDHIYMGHGYNKGFPLCLELKTGKVAWRPGRGAGNGSASVLYADGDIYFRYEDGTIVLVEATPTAYTVKAKFKTPPDTDTEWAHPVISHGRLYLRGQNRLLCYNVAK